MNAVRLLMSTVLLAVVSSNYAQTNDSTSYQLKDLVVTGTRHAEDSRHLPMTVTVIDHEKLTEQHQTNILPTAMQQVPSFFVTSRSMLGYGVSTGAAGTINMRGISGGSGQLMVLIDGHPQYNGIYGHPISDAYQTLMAERVEVLRGPASVLYGSNAMGGVLNIVTRQPQADGTYYNLALSGGSYGTLQGEISRLQRSGRLGTTVALQYGRTDNHRPRMGFEQYGGYAKVAYDISAHWNAYVDANVTHFNASYPGKSFAPKYGADQWITRGVASAALENHFNCWDGALSFYTNYGRHKIDDGTDNPVQPTQRYFRSKDALTGVSFYESAHLFQGNRITAGLDYTHIYGHAFYTSKQTGEILNTSNKQSGKSTRNEIAAYVDVRQDLLTWLMLDAGFRLDHHSISGTEWIPQAGVVVRPLETGEMKAMVSKGFRNPTMREMFLYPSSNTDLLPERLWNYELSWRQHLDFPRLSRALTYGINLFYINGDNIILTIPVGGGKKNLNVGKIENYGAEAELSCQINAHWSINTNHSFLKMKKDYVIAAPKYKGFLGATFREAKWKASLGVQYLSGLGLDVNDDGLADQTSSDICLLNASIDYTVMKDLSLWVRAENLFAQRYEINFGYLMPRVTCMAGLNWCF